MDYRYAEWERDVFKISMINPMIFSLRIVGVFTMLAVVAVAQTPIVDVYCREGAERSADGRLLRMVYFKMLIKNDGPENLRLPTSGGVVGTFLETSPGSPASFRARYTIDFERDSSDQILIPSESRLMLVVLGKGERAQIEFRCPLPEGYPDLSINAELVVTADLARRFSLWSGSASTVVKILK